MIELALRKLGDARIIHEVPAGSSVIADPYRRGFFVAHPERPPYLVRWNGTTEEIKPAESA